MDSQQVRNLQEAYIDVYEGDLTEEQEFKSWVTELLDEGYDLSDYTWDEMYEIYNEEYKGGPAFGMKYSKPKPLSGEKGDRSGYGGDEKFTKPDDKIEKPGTTVPPFKKGGYGRIMSNIPHGIGDHRDKIQSRISTITGKDPGAPTSQKMTPKEKKKNLEIIRKKKIQDSYDLYDTILSHLIDEGYADTYEAAESIMVNMSEEWRDDILNEGIGSAIKSLFGKKKEPEAPKAPEPLSRGAELRRRYNTGPEKSNTSVKRAIINRARDNASRAQGQVDRGNASQSYADKATGAVDSYLKAGYNKYGADRSDSGGMGGSGGSGRGNKARKRAAALAASNINASYEPDLFDYIMEYLMIEGYANTNENALVIMANMSEEWRENILNEATDDPIDVDHKMQRLPNNKTPKPTPQQTSAIASALKLRAKAKQK